MTAYYNEIDPKAAAWLRELIARGLIAQGWSMSVTFATCDQPTFMDLLSAISSPASGSGPMPCAVPVGPMTVPSGPVPAPASLSPRQAKAAGLMTSGTYGRHGIGSSNSAALQSSLESRLRARLLGLGSTLYKLTWKRWATPSGVSRFRLRASVPRTSATGRTGLAHWSTPRVEDTSNETWETKQARNARHLAEGRNSGKGWAG